VEEPVAGGPRARVSLGDGFYVKAGLEKDKAAMLVVLAVLWNGQKIVPAVESGYRESTERWAALPRDLTARGLRAAPTA
jgi:putative transposase